jgi:transposase
MYDKIRASQMRAVEILKRQRKEDFNLLLGKDHFIYDVKEDADTVNVFIKSSPHSCLCPKCGEESRALHATYERTMQDTPLRGKQTYLNASVYKYECCNPKCDRKVFAEPLPFARMSATRTDALNQLVMGVSMFLSNEGASKVLSLLGVTVSNDTIQRLCGRIEFADNPDIEEIGVDDVAKRKGQSYATAIYDLKTHQLVALLDGRDGKTFREWLEGHKKIRLVARDRASAYAKAIRDTLPECVQVADRFHLFQNLIDRLRDIFRDEIPPEIFIRDGDLLDAPPKKINVLKPPDEKTLGAVECDNSPPRRPDGAILEYDNKNRDLGSRQYKSGKEKAKKNRT